jgi:hypothetical protein
MGQLMYLKMKYHIVMVCAKTDVTKKHFASAIDNRVIRKSQGLSWLVLQF